MKIFKILITILISSIFLPGCSESNVENDENVDPLRMTSIKGKFIRDKDNNRAGFEKNFQLIKDIEFKGNYCHFTYATIKMNGKFEIDEGFVYINTGTELGILSMEIISNNQLEGEGYIHGTFKREGAFKPVEKIKQTKKTNRNSDILSSSKSESNKPFGDSDYKEEPESNESEPTSGNEESNPFGSGGNNFGSDAGKEAFVSGSGGSGNGPSANNRTRLNDVQLSGLENVSDEVIYLKLTVNAEGSVVSAQNISSKTTTTDQVLINKLILAVKNQVRYNKEPGAPLCSMYYTVHLKGN